MSKKTQRQYGLWDSPISPAMLAASLRLQDVHWDDKSGSVVWLEGRSGQGVLVADAMDDGVSDATADTRGRDAPRDLTSDLAVRAEVGYGGGDFAVHGGVVYFVVQKTGRIFRQNLAGGPARPITPSFGKAAAPAVSPFGSWIVYVHHEEGVDRLAIADTDGKLWPQSLVQGDDFYMQPVWSPDGKRIAWVSWNHPQMPWDGSRLHLATVEEVAGSAPILTDVQVLAGSDDEAIFQPEFTRDGKSLVFVSDADGWSHLYCHDLSSGTSNQVTRGEGDHGLPAWVQNMRSYGLTADGKHAVCARGEQGFVRIQRIELATGEVETVESLSAYTDALQFSCAARGNRVAFIGSGSQIPSRVVLHDFDSNETRVLARSSGETLLPDVLSTPEALVWETGDGESAHGLLYSPTNPNFESAGKPPLLVLIHGGPTAQARAQWNPQAQFFATRGYAVLMVNHRGSTGYGREYMNRLRGDWGICDVEDAVRGVEHLAQADRIDAARTAIMGGSAGGFTVLQTMITAPEVFTAGVSLYGVSNQFSLVSDTHKFEDRYSESLLGPLPERSEIYRERSPVFHADRIRRPLAVFQGEIDQVVPRDQSDAIVAALQRAGTPFFYHVYEGEGHGWRQRETIEHFYTAVASFLRDHVVYS